MSERLSKAYSTNILTMQQMVTRYLKRLERLSGQNYEEDEVLCAEWARQFGTKETPLSVLQKLVAMQKTTYELLQKAQTQEGKERGAHTALKEEDWQIIELALADYKAQQSD